MDQREQKEIQIASPISLRLRFAILERDGYRCVYCGRSSQGVSLEVDHVIPRACGGSNDSTNLVTACFDCNHGKGVDSRRLPPNYVPTEIILPPRPARSGGAGPIVIEGVCGWPLPDIAWDSCIDAGGPYRNGWLPWAVMPLRSPWYKGRGFDWYVGFYSCDRGHVWTCGYADVLTTEEQLSEVRSWLVSPLRTVPSPEYLAQRDWIGPLVGLQTIDWSPVVSQAQ